MQMTNDHVQEINEKTSVLIWQKVGALLLSGEERNIA